MRLNVDVGFRFNTVSGFDWQFKTLMPSETLTLEIEGSGHSFNTCLIINFTHFNYSFFLYFFLCNYVMFFYSFHT